MLRPLVDLLKTTLLGGLFILLPLLLLCLAIQEVFGLLVALATPIADLFPEGTFDRIASPEVIAVLLIIVASFALGLLARLALTRRVGLWIESRTVGRLPLYSVLKQLLRRFVEIEGDTTFQPALFDAGDDRQDLIYAIEDLGDGRMVILVPRAPTGFAGQVRIVPRDRVRLLEVTVGEVSKVLGHWGVGTGAMLRSAAAAGS
jgi:uncharacterized membrane protein